MKILLVILFTTSLFANDYRFEKLVEEKTSLIDRYKIRVEVARLDKFYKRVKVLSKTLNCFKNSRSKREITACKINENKRIMNLITKS